MKASFPTIPCVPSAAGTAGIVPWGSLLFMALFWASLLALRYPPGCIDNFYFVGAAINLVHGGTFSNPYCPGLATIGAADHFFVYMPLHSYVLAGWLKVLGVTRISFELFQIMVSFVSCMALRIIFSGRSQNYFVTLAICLATEGFVGNTGLRPDGLGLALLTCGTVLLLSSTSRRWILGSICLSLALITAPNYSVILPPIYVYAWYRLPAETRSLRDFCSRLCLVGSSGVLVFLLFLRLIGFQLLLFLHIFQAARKVAFSFLVSDIANRHQGMHAIIKLIAQVFLPCLLIGITLLCLALADRLFTKLPRALLAVLVTTQLLLFLTAFSSGSGIILLSYFSILLALALVCWLKPFYAPFGTVFWFCLWGVFILAVAHKNLVLVTTHLLAPPPLQSALKDQIEKGVPKRIYLDEYALEGVYDDDPPANTYDVHWGLNNGAWNAFTSPQAFPSGSTLVLSPETLYLMDRRTRSANFHPIPVVGRWFETSGSPYNCLIVRVP